MLGKSQNNIGNYHVTNESYNINDIIFGQYAMFSNGFFPELKIY